MPKGDQRDEHASARAAGSARALARVARMQQVTKALASALTADDIARVFFDLGLELPRADAGTLCLVVEPGTLGMAYVHGASPRVKEAWDRFPIDAPLLVSQAVATRTPLWLETPEEIAARFPAMADAARAIGHQAMAALPLHTQDGAPLGALGVAYTTPHRFDDDDRAFLVTLAEAAAVALDRARLYEAERAARAEAERISAIQEKLIGVVGHDLRGPLQTITLGTDLLRRAASDPEQSRVVVERIRRAAARAGRILGDLFEWSRARHGLELAVHAERVDVGAIARRLVAEHDGTSDADRITVRADGDVTLDADPDRLAQLLGNLLSNALDHGVGAVRVTVVGQPGDVVLSVENAGPPIPAELLPRLFEPFTKGARGDAGGAHHVGLGLFIVAELAKAHGGAVDVRSSEADGTRFTVRLPRRRQASRLGS
jgi:signal transduction histidine kinase